MQTSQLLTHIAGVPRIDPAVAIGVGFKYDPNIDIAGGSNDWMYSDRGILAYCTELWHLFKASGVFGEDRMKPHSEVRSYQTGARMARGMCVCTCVYLTAVLLWAGRPHWIPEARKGRGSCDCPSVVRRELAFGQLLRRLDAL